MSTVSTPSRLWTARRDSWKRCRAIIEGPAAAKAHDIIVSYDNLLIPFSPGMHQDQYDILRAEAELPGVTAQFVKILTETLLRKRPVVSVDGMPDDVNSWLLNEFGQDGSPIEQTISTAVQEELTTGAAWLFVDHPRLDATVLDGLSPAELREIKPYPVIRKAEEVINFRYGIDKTGNRQLLFVIVCSKELDYSVDHYNGEERKIIYEHYLDDEGTYKIAVHRPGAEVEKLDVLVHGQPLSYIPAWPLGTAEGTPPLLPIIEREIALYNKVTRRNHLLYNASAFTPVVISDMPEENFYKAVSSGLGTWLLFPEGTELDTIRTPTDALEDYDRAITDSLTEIARLGVRMLSPESAQSGIALQIRNAAQTAQLGAMNAKLTATMKQVIRCMLHWRYGEEPDLDKVKFQLSGDFLQTALSEGLVRLVGEWYDSGLISREVFLHVIQRSDLTPEGYDDERAQESVRERQNLPPLEP